MKNILLLGLVLACAIPAAQGAISRDPYLGAIAVDARDGRVLFEDNADAPLIPPACSS
jgi:D-alanyl-D-alanine carboxypeptidase